MAYIYQIINDINDKIYVGKTELSLEKRFKQHCTDYFKERNKNRPLYRAMNKYGIEHFHIELIEETDNPEEREIYWIKEKNSYGRTGYNATLGGDGKKYLDENLIIQEYLILKSQKKVSEKLKIDVGSVRRILRNNNISIITHNSPNKKAVKQCDRQGKVIQTFESCGAAARWLISQGITKAQIGTVTNKVSETANHIRKSAYNFIWEFI